MYIIIFHKAVLIFGFKSQWSLNKLLHRFIIIRYKKIYNQLFVSNILWFKSIVIFYKITHCFSCFSCSFFLIYILLSSLLKILFFSNCVKRFLIRIVYFHISFKFSKKIQMTCNWERSMSFWNTNFDFR